MIWGIWGWWYTNMINANLRFLYRPQHYRRMRGAPRCLSWWRLWLWISAQVLISHQALRWQHTACLGFSLSLALSAPPLAHVHTFSIFMGRSTNANRVLINLPFGFYWICIVNVTNLPYNLENIPRKHCGPQFSIFSWKFITCSVYFTESIWDLCSVLCLEPGKV